MSCITSFRWWCTGTPNSHSFLLWTLTRCVHKHFRWSTLIGATHITQLFEREYSQWSHVLPVRACWSSMVSSSRWWRSGCCPRWRWSPPPPRRHRLLSPSGGSTWRGALKHFQNWVFPHFFCSPSNFLCGWQDILLRTLAVRNKGWDLQQYQDSSLSSVLLFSSQGQLKLIEQTGTFFPFSSKLLYRYLSVHLSHLYKPISRVTTKTLTSTYTLLTQLHLGARLWPLIATLTSHSKFLLKSRALNMALQNIMHWL